MHVLCFLDFRLDRAARTLTRAGKPLTVVGKTFELLAFMVENPNRPLLKKELLDAVWPDSFVEESNLTQTVFVLRKTLGPDGSQIIQTLTGRGYQFTAAVTELPELTKVAQAGIAQALAVTTTRSAMRIVYEEESEEHVRFWRSPLVLGLSAAAVVLLGVTGWLGWQRYEDRVGGPPVQIVLADQEGSTGDPILDRTLTSILRFQLAQSPFVTVVPVATVRQTMQQMRLKPDTPLSGSVAQDLCERTSSQAVLRGTVVHAGSEYILTEEATNCVDGSNLGGARQQVARLEDLPTAIDKLGAAIRHTLGESRRTIARYNRPLAAVDTASIEALKNFSQANYVAQTGRFPEAIALLKQAIALDPKFAAAYLNLSVFTSNTLDPESPREYLRKAYELREGTTEPIRLFIAAKYDTDIREDLYQSLRDYQAWVNLYPRSAQAWSGMTQVYRELGDHQNALRTSQRTKELAPNNVVAYQALADAQSKTGDFAAARATCALALSHGFDGENIRFLLLRLGYLLNDEQLVAEQREWANTHPDATILLTNEAEYALQQGQFNRADMLIQQINAAYDRMGSPQAFAYFAADVSLRYMDLGEDERGRALLLATKPDAESYEYLLALINSGQQKEAEKLLAQQLATHPQATLWNLRYAPLLRGQLALLHGNAQAAIVALAPTRQLDGTSLDGFYLRGQAFLLAHRLPEAEAEFRTLLSHPEIEPTSVKIPLAQLQLARVLTAQAKPEAAIFAYRLFMQKWSKSEASPVLLKQANMELAKLTPTP